MEGDTKTSPINQSNFPLEALIRADDVSLVAMRTIVASARLVAHSIVAVNNASVDEVDRFNLGPIRTRHRKFSSPYSLGTEVYDVLTDTLVPIDCCTLSNLGPIGDGGRDWGKVYCRTWEDGGRD